MADTEKQAADEFDFGSNLEILTDIFRILTFLEQRLNQLARKSYHNRSQYPEAFFEIESALHAIKSWAWEWRCFCGVATFGVMLIVSLEELSILMESFLDVETPVKGKKRTKRSRLAKEQKKAMESVRKMLDHAKKKLKSMDACATSVGWELEEAVVKSFKDCCAGGYEKKIRPCVSKRGEKTYIFPCSNKKDYLRLVENKKRFRKEVADELESCGHVVGHKALCKSSKKYVLAGFRSNARKTIMEGGKQETFPIRMVKCADCGQRFSLIPSFLPREKHFGIDLIGNIVRGIVLRGASLHSAMENFELTGFSIKSRQTILNWLRWFGTLHPAEVAVRAGAKCSGYFQEDEGFEKESGFRTYTAVMVDPESLLVWHLDYLDHVDEQTLVESFEKFVERIDFKVLGVTKDKWAASTNALKTVCRQLWIGFCHRHCLRKFRDRLSQYQKETGCADKDVNKLYRDFKKALNAGSSKVSLAVQINFLKDEAFNHPLLRQVMDEVKKNAVYYASHKIRQGIKKTTSIADNFLKTVKRKLRQVESFREQESAGLLFRAMANVRNFVPFTSGSKNAHKSPFMLARGKTHDLPWVQVMNVHNAFLFTENAA
jgi:hypothetical protein